jgi:hypothetical protein
LICWCATASSGFTGGATVSASAGTLTSVLNAFATTDTGNNLAGGYSAILTGGVIGTTITFALTMTSGTASNLYLSLMPSGLTAKKYNIDDKLFKSFLKFMEQEKETRADEDKILLNRVTEMQSELDHMSFKQQQDEEEGLSLSDEEDDYTETVVDAAGSKVVRMRRALPRVEPTYNVESSFAHGSELARKAQKVAVRSHAELIAPPTETISISVKGKDKH